MFIFSAKKMSVYVRVCSKNARMLRHERTRGGPERFMLVMCSDDNSIFRQHVNVIGRTTSCVFGSTFASLTMTSSNDF